MLIYPYTKGKGMNRSRMQESALDVHCCTAHSAAVDGPYSWKLCRLGIERPSGKRTAAMRRSGDGKRKAARDDDDEAWVPRREARRQATLQLERLHEGDPESAEST